MLLLLNKLMGGVMELQEQSDCLATGTLECLYGFIGVALYVATSKYV